MFVCCAAVGGSAHEFYDEAKNAFLDKPSHFAVGADKGDVVDPRRTNKKARLWAADTSFAEKGVIYEIKTDAKGIVAVMAHTSGGESQGIAVKDFTPRLDAGLWAVSDGKAVWIFGTGKRIRTIPLPEDGADIDPLDRELGEIDVTLESLGVKRPDVQYQLSLRPKGGKKDLPLGLVPGCEQFPIERVRDAVKGSLVEKKTAENLAKLKKPKPKRFKPTVVFYDGEEIFKSINGVTRVPKMPPRRRSRKDYFKLRDEAARQVEKARKIEKENAAALRAYEQKRNDTVRNTSVGDQEIDDALRQYVLLIERNLVKAAEAD